MKAKAVSRVTGPSCVSDVFVVVWALATRGFHMSSDPNGKEAGLKFLEANKSKEGINVLPSGLQYKVLMKVLDWSTQRLERLASATTPAAFLMARLIATFACFF